MPPLTKRLTHCRAGRAAALLLAVLLLAAAVLAAWPAAASAQDESRAGLVVVHGDGSVVQQCVTFVEESISGYELLRRAGLDLKVEAGGFGTTVCSIAGEGCSFPAESCFCRCQGSPCVYWSYWRRQPSGEWFYQVLGAGNTQVKDGDVEGWRWAAGTTRTAQEPPAVRFEDICAAPETDMTLAAGAAVTGAVPPTANEPMTEEAAAARSALSTTEAVAAADQASAAGGQVALAAGETSLQSPVRLVWFVLIGVVVAPVAMLAVWALLRRKR